MLEINRPRRELKRRKGNGGRGRGGVGTGGVGLGDQAVRMWERRVDLPVPGAPTRAMRRGLEKEGGGGVGVMCLEGRGWRLGTPRRLSLLSSFVRGGI